MRRRPSRFVDLVGAQLIVIRSLGTWRLAARARHMRYRLAKKLGEQLYEREPREALGARVVPLERRGNEMKWKIYYGEWGAVVLE